MELLYVDFETRGPEELHGKMSVGLHNYAQSAEALMLSWAPNQESVNLWLCRELMPARLRKGIEDKNVLLVSWNSTFERYIFKYCLGIDIPIERWIDPQVSARYLSLPGKLKDVSEILGLGKDMGKDKEGGRLIDMFSKPTIQKATKANGLKENRVYYRDATTDPEDWKLFCEYCRQDVVAEREILRRLTLLEVYPLPEKERQFWIMDQRINDRGIPVDVEFVKKALKLATKEKELAVEKQNRLTGLANANSPKQMLAWAQKQGFVGSSLRKEAVASQLKYNEQLTPVAREVLNARKAASSTSYKKLAAFLRLVSSDNRLRNQFIFLGSSRCGRWSSGGGQLHNLSRPEKQFEDKKVLDRARQLVHEEDFDDLVKEFGSVLLTVKSLIRTVFSVENL